LCHNKPAWYGSRAKNVVSRDVNDLTASCIRYESFLWVKNSSACMKRRMPFCFKCTTKNASRKRSHTARCVASLRCFSTRCEEHQMLNSYTKPMNYYLSNGQHFCYAECFYLPWRQLGPFPLQYYHLCNFVIFSLISIIRFVTL